MTIVPTWPNFPPAQQHHYSANISPSRYPPPSHSQGTSLNQPQNLPAAHPMPNTTLNTNRNTNQGRNFAAKMPIEFTPIPVFYTNLLPYLLDNSMVAITHPRFLNLHFFEDMTRMQHVLTMEKFRGIPLSIIGP